MRNIFYTVVCLFSLSISAQVYIGTGSGEMSSTSTILEFENDNTRGLILPIVSSTADVSAVNGALVMDANTQKVMVYEAGSWKDLSNHASVPATAVTAPSGTEVGEGLVIGTLDDNKNGILVLNDETKALALPKVDDFKSLGTPSAGTIVYDLSRKALCVFNGAQWTIWK